MLVGYDGRRLWSAEDVVGCETRSWMAENVVGDRDDDSKEKKNER